MKHTILSKSEFSPSMLPAPNGVNTITLEGRGGPNVMQVIGGQQPNDWSIQPDMGRRVMFHQGPDGGYTVEPNPILSGVFHVGTLSEVLNYI